WHDSASLFNHMIVQLGDDPYRSDIDRRLGMLYATADPPDWDKADQAFSRGVQANPRDEYLRALLAELWLRQGSTSRAVQLLRDGVNLAPDSLDLRFRLALALGIARRYPEAIEEFSEVLRRDPNHEQAKRGLAAARQSLE